MGTALNSLDSMLSLAQTHGMFRRFFADRIAASTAGGTTANPGGFINVQRFTRTITVPSLGTGVTGVYFTHVYMATEDALCPLMAALEYDLGTLNVSANTFSGGGSMPTKDIEGESIQTATMLLMLAPSVAAAGLDGKIVTVSYTNQDGTAGRTATVTLPASNMGVLGSAALVSTLQSGDTGVRSVEDLDLNTAGSAGTVKAYGLLPIGIEANSAKMGGLDFLSTPLPMWKAIENEKIAFYRFANNVTCDFFAVLAGIADD